MIEYMTVTLHPEIAQKIREFCESKDRTISAVMRKGALELIQKESKND